MAGVNFDESETILFEKLSKMAEYTDIGDAAIERSTSRSPRESIDLKESIVSAYSAISFGVPQ